MTQPVCTCPNEDTLLSSCVIHGARMRTYDPRLTFTEPVTKEQRAEQLMAKGPIWLVRRVMELEDAAAEYRRFSTWSEYGDRGAEAFRRLQRALHG